MCVRAWVGVRWHTAAHLLEDDALRERHHVVELDELGGREGRRVGRREDPVAVGHRLALGRIREEARREHGALPLPDVRDAAHVAEAVVVGVEGAADECVGQVLVKVELVGLRGVARAGGGGAGRAARDW